MVDGFWASKRLDAAQRERLAATQYADLEQRFGGDGSGRVLKGSLVAAADGGRVVGMASLELGLFDGAALSLLPRDEAAEKIRASAPLLANVAVVPGARRKGLGRRLVAACADLARDGWGYDDVLLEVECDNRPAVALYERVGFQELWRAPRAALEVDPRRESGRP
ncbi:Acetyltransferase [Aureococcus anophagefferens]|nr:Acetyltransferase [Aureococcus anophagefferens]